MASPTSPTHGKWGAIYRRRPNGFKGSGLNDASWGTGYNGASSAYFEVEIQTEGSPDQFKWRKDGGTWTENVDITGSAQTLSDGQTITFGATTGHSAGDQWVIGNLKDEACTESGDEAQITDSAKRLLNPNSPPAFSDSGGANVLTVNYLTGLAVFDDNVATVTVTGNDGYILEASLEKVGYLYGWNFDATVDMADASRMGQSWKEAKPGQANISGTAESYFIGTKSFFDGLKDAATGGEEYFLLQLFNYDPDQDQTGDHFSLWVSFSGVSFSASIGDIVKERVNFTSQGMPAFTANS